jgi:hypothetical protein
VHLALDLASELVADKRFELMPLSALGHAPHGGVSEPAAEPARKLSGPVGSTGHLQDRLRARPSDRLVGPERRRDVVAPRKLAGEHDRILDCLRGA